MMAPKQVHKAIMTDLMKLISSCAVVFLLVLLIIIINLISMLQTPSKALLIS